MKVFSSINEFKPKTDTIVTIGTFDGVHLGHQKIIKKLALEAQKTGLESTILTFFPHPRMVLQNDSNIKLLNTIQEKIKLLEELGVQNLIIHPFDEVFSNLSAEDFVKNILIEKLHLRKIIIGYDHRFGKNRSANIDDLIRFGKEYNFEVEQISAKEINDVAISSTKIRKSIDSGNINNANQFLGYNYSLTGKVIKGNQLGRTIGFPTANIFIEENYKLIPKNGVYICEAIYKNKIFQAITNIGTRPTINGKELRIETNIFDFDEDIYDKKLTVEFLDHIRDEKKFDSIDELKSQIEADKTTALRYFSK